MERTQPVTDDSPRIFALVTPGGVQKPRSRGPDRLQDRLSTPTEIYLRVRIIGAHLQRLLEECNCLHSLPFSGQHHAQIVERIGIPRGELDSLSKMHDSLVGQATLCTKRTQIIVRLKSPGLDLQTLPEPGFSVRWPAELNECIGQIVERRTILGIDRQDDMKMRDGLLVESLFVQANAHVIMCVHIQRGEF